jgi:hypothetical protein
MLRMFVTKRVTSRRLDILLAPAINLYGKHSHPLCCTPPKTGTEKRESGPSPDAPDRTNRVAESDVGQQVEILIVFVLATFSFAK